jgi:hypothetical protein
MRRSSGRLLSGAQTRLGGAVVSAPRQATTSAHAGWRRLATAASGPAQPLVPPFTEQTARAKVQAAENLWNTKDPSKVSITILLVFIL